MIPIKKFESKEKKKTDLISRDSLGLKISNNEQTDNLSFGSKSYKNSLQNNKLRRNFEKTFLYYHYFIIDVVYIYIYIYIYKYIYIYIL